MNVDILREAIAHGIFETLTELAWPEGADVGELADYRETAGRLVEKYIFVPRRTENDPLRDAIAGEIFESLISGFAWPRDPETPTPEVVVERCGSTLAPDEMQRMEAIRSLRVKYGEGLIPLAEYAAIGYECEPAERAAPVFANSNETE